MAFNGHCGVSVFGLLVRIAANLGDDYTRIGDLAEAKLAYRHSYLIDYVLNWRGLSDMIGAQNGISLEMSD